MKLMELIPGTKIEVSEERTYTFVGLIPIHPIWPYLCLMVWRSDDGEWFHDALPRGLDVSQVGQIIEGDPNQLLDNLRNVLLHPSHRYRSTPRPPDWEARNKETKG